MKVGDTFYCVTDQFSILEVRVTEVNHYATGLVIVDTQLAEDYAYSDQEVYQHQFYFKRMQYMQSDGLSKANVSKHYLLSSLRARVGMLAKLKELTREQTVLLKKLSDLVEGDSDD